MGLKRRSRFDLDRCLAAIAAGHVPGPQRGEARILQFARKSGYELPADMITFYQRHDGARLFDDSDDAPYALLPLDRVRRARVAVAGDDRDACAPASWYAFCRVGNGELVAVDLTPGNHGRIIDCWRETFGSPGDMTVIARSFTEFLHRALASKGEAYWLVDRFSGYGDPLAGRVPAPGSSAFDKVVRAHGDVFFHTHKGGTSTRRLGVYMDFELYLRRVQFDGEPYSPAIEIQWLPIQQRDWTELDGARFTVSTADARARFMHDTKAVMLRPQVLDVRLSFKQRGKRRLEVQLDCTLQFRGKRVEVLRCKGSGNAPELPPR